MEHGSNLESNSNTFLIEEDDIRDFFLFCDDKKRDLPRYKLDWKSKPQLKTSLDNTLDNHNAEAKLTKRRHELLKTFHVSTSACRSQLYPDNEKDMSLFIKTRRMHEAIKNTLVTARSRRTKTADDSIQEIFNRKIPKRREFGPRIFLGSPVPNICTKDSNISTRCFRRCT
jgi:hypothetical protein